MPATSAGMTIAEATGASFALHHLLLLLAQAIDAERYHVAGFQERRRLHAEADAGGRAGDDDVARLQDEILRAAPDQVAAVEDHGRGIAALALFAVDVEPHGKLLRILELILGDEPGTERAEHKGFDSG